MLLVSFHGGTSSGSVNNLYVYDTNDKSLLTKAALGQPGNNSLSELRAMVVANGYLYVANGGKLTSDVLCYQPPASGTSFAYLSTVISAATSNGDFDTSIAHPFGIAVPSTALCYVSNQDTNVVALVNLTANGQDGNLGTGCQSTYLNNLFPPPAVFLDGTYVASQDGNLHGVSVKATNVPASEGGLGMTLGHSSKVQNSVRDIGIANGILFVCDEPDSLVNMYSLTDGSFLGCSNSLSGNPTHLAIQNGGLYVSAGSLLYWGQLPNSVQGASLSLQTIALTTPNDDKIGGISFANGAGAATVYAPFQPGTGGADGGSIYSYTVTQSSPSTLPVFSNKAEFVSSGSSTFEDTPEFVLYMSG